MKPKDICVALTYTLLHFLVACWIYIPQCHTVTAGDSKIFFLLEIYETKSVVTAQRLIRREHMYGHSSNPSILAWYKCFMNNGHVF